MIKINMVACCRKLILMTCTKSKTWANKSSLKSEINPSLLMSKKKTTSYRSESFLIHDWTNHTEEDLALKVEMTISRQKSATFIFKSKKRLTASSKKRQKTLPSTWLVKGCSILACWMSKSRWRKLSSILKIPAFLKERISTAWACKSSSLTWTTTNLLQFAIILWKAGKKTSRTKSWRNTMFRDKSIVKSL